MADNMKTSRRKIAIIGGGSAYLPVFLSAFIEVAEAFTGSEIWLMDIDEPHLNVIHQLGRKLASAAGASIDICKTTTRREALEDADFVLTTFRPGGFEARTLDEKIPLKYGVIGQETVGPGGFFMALRSVNVIRGIVQEMEELAPGALLFNYTNPTNIVAEAITHHSPIHVIGLCDQSQGDRRRLANVLGVELSQVDYAVSGLNHATWSTHFRVDGKDGFPLLMKSMSAALHAPDIDPAVKRMLTLARRFGRIPNRYWQYYYFHEELVDEAQKAQYCRAEQIMQELPDYYQHYAEQSRKPAPILEKMRGGSKAFGDFAVDVICSVALDRDDVHILNVPNQGAMSEFDSDRIVEVSCRVNRDGAFPLLQVEMAHEGLGLMKMLSEYQYLAAKAAWSGTRHEAIQALMSNPLIFNIQRAESLYNEMVQAHAEHLPRRLLE